METERLGDEVKRETTCSCFCLGSQLYAEVVVKIWRGIQRVAKENAKRTRRRTRADAAAAASLVRSYGRPCNNLLAASPTMTETSTKGLCSRRIAVRR